MSVESRNNPSVDPIISGHATAEDWQVKASQISREAADPLLGCLMIMVRHFGRSLSSSVLVSGLPLEDNRLTPALFLRAAERAGLSSRLVSPATPGNSPSRTSGHPVAARSFGRRALAYRRRPGRSPTAGNRTGGDLDQSCRTRDLVLRTRGVHPPPRPAACGRRRARGEGIRIVVLGYAPEVQIRLSSSGACRVGGEPVLACRSAVHDERLRPGGAEQRGRNLVGAGNRHRDRLRLRLPAEGFARLSHRSRGQARRHPHERADFRACDERTDCRRGQARPACSQAGSRNSRWCATSSPRRR